MNIEKFSDPKNVTYICEEAFFACFSFHFVEIQSDSILKKMEKKYFANTSIESFAISLHEKQIRMGIL